MIGSTFIAGGMVAGSGQFSTVPSISFEPTQIWPGYTVTGTAIEINIADLPGMTSGLAAEGTGDAREVVYRVMLSAGTFYEGENWDLQAQTGKVRVSDQYTYYSTLGDVLRRIIQAQITLDVENGGVTDEPI